MNTNTAQNNVLITDAEDRHCEWCRDRGWTRVEDMTRLFSAGNDEEYRLALKQGDENAR